MTTKIDTRQFAGAAIELRAAADGRKIEGYAALFDVRTEICGCFVELIERGAFAAAIKEDDVRGLINHDRNLVLGRTASGTLKLAEDTKGLAFEIDPPNTSFANDLKLSMERGDINECSFAFRVKEEAWDWDSEKLPVRTLKDLGLVDVSIVTYPAYPETSAGLRSFELAKAEHLPLITAGSASPARLRMKAGLAHRERGIPRL